MQKRDGMKRIKVRNVVIGEGKPKICVSIIGETLAEIIESAEVICELPVDIVEWRADWFLDVKKWESVKLVLSEIRAVLGEKPLLFTFRTKEEGGQREIDKTVYEALCMNSAQSGMIDMLDVEAFFEEGMLTRIKETAQKVNVIVVASFHNFAETPSMEEMFERLMKMEEMGADIVKMAVMPHSERDVLRLLDVTLRMKERNGNVPVVTMSMDRKGMVSRISGEIFGSAITFGAVGIPSAPGQIEVCELDKILNLLHS